MEPTKYYRQPRSTFRCGLASDGRPCIHGPNGRKCGQSEPGAETCYPARTLTGWMKLAATGATVLALGMVALILAFPGNPIPLAPGPLANPHAQLLLNSDSAPHGMIGSNHRCAACHPSSQSDLLKDKTHPLVQGKLVSAKVGSQSQLCMNCHIETIPTGLEGSPHDFVGEELQRMLQILDGVLPRDLALHATECSQCHKEHRGSGEDLQSITSSKCQSCHRKQFESFTSGHPEFANYPVHRPRAIAFDHSRHQEIHYAKKNASFECRECHVQTGESGTVGNVFRSVPYEKACAKCHDEPLRSAASDGLIVLQMPSLDRAKIEAHGMKLGAWPVGASQLMDGAISPLLQVLLEQNPNGKAALEKLPPSKRMNDVNLGDPSQAKAVVELAEAIRQSVGRLAREGQPFLKSSMEANLASLDSNRRSNATAFNATFSQQPRSETGKWTPGDSFNNPVAAPKSRDAMPVAAVSFAGLQTTPSAKWLEQFSRGMPPDLVRLAMREWFGPYDASGSNLANLPENLPSGKITSVRARREPNQDDDLLAPLPTLPPRSGQGTPKAPQDDLLGGGDDLLNNSSEPTLNHGGQGLLENKTKSNANGFGPLKTWQHLPFGGWMLDSSRVSLVYVPSGHGDHWVARWLEWQTQWTNSSGADRALLLDNFSKQCLQCHAIQANNVSALLKGNTPSNRLIAFRSGATPSQESHEPEQVLDSCWKIQQRPSGERPITRFDHTPHLTIPSLSDCKSCHVLSAEQSHGVGEQPLGWDPSGMVLHHEFRTMRVGQCSSCHNPRAAGENCTQCHNYHVHAVRH